MGKAKCYCFCGHEIVYLGRDRNDFPDWRCSFCGDRYIIATQINPPNTDSTPMGYSCACPN